MSAEPMVANDGAASEPMPPGFAAKKTRYSVQVDILPLGDRLVVHRFPEPTKTAGGLEIPEGAREKPLVGRVIAVGEERLTWVEQVAGLCYLLLDVLSYLPGCGRMKNSDALGVLRSGAKLSKKLAKVGDAVLFSRYGGCEVPDEVYAAIGINIQSSLDLIMIKEAEILGIVTMQRVEVPEAPEAE